MHLYSDEPFELAVGRIVVDDFAHDMPIEDVDKHVATNDQVILVPIVGLDESLEIVGAAEASDDCSAATRHDMGDGAAYGKKRAPALLVILPGEFIFAIDVRLIAAQQPLGTGNLDAAIVDAAVAMIGDANSALSSKFAGVPPRQRGLGNGCDSQKNDEGQN